MDEVRMTPLSFKRNADDALERLACLYDRRAADRVCVAFDNPSVTLDRFSREATAGYCEYPDPAARIAFWEAVLREKCVVADDAVPSVYLTELDQGLYGGLLDGDVRFMCDPATGWVSSMVAPMVAQLSDFEPRALLPDHPWMVRFRRQVEVFAERAEGQFGVSHLILIDGLNFLFELVGATRTYEALIDEPEQVKQITDYAYHLNLEIHSRFFEMVPDVGGGTCSSMAQWLPGRIVSESVDPFHMTSVDYFENWGREPVERIFAQFDGGIVHLHGNGRHLLEAVSTLIGLKAILLGDDKGFPAAFDVLGELRDRAGEVPLVVATSFAAFERQLTAHALVGGTLYVVRNDRGADAANALMDRARAYRL